LGDEVKVVPVPNKAPRHEDVSYA